MATHNAIARKDVKLATGESIGDFTRTVSDQGKKYLAQKQNLAKGSYIYVVEIFSTMAIFSVYVPPSDDDGRGEDKYFAVAYSRNKEGNFEFGTITEVERSTTWTPKQKLMTTAKSDPSPGWRPRINWGELL